MSDERLCIVCPVYRAEPRTVVRPQVCELDRDRLLADLGDILELVALAGQHIELQPGSGPKVTGTRERPAPLNLTALGVSQPRYARTADMLDLGHDPATASDQLGFAQPVAVLDQWVSDWIDVRALLEHPPLPNLGSITHWLDVRLDWACDEHPAIDEFARELKDMTRALKGIVRDKPTGEPAGRCPAILRDETRCNTRLFADPYVEKITCDRCGKSWERRNAGWMHLRAQQAEWEEAA